MGIATRFPIPKASLAVNLADSILVPVNVSAT
jgi:hypothetical protein